MNMKPLFTNYGLVYKKNKYEEDELRTAKGKAKKIVKVDKDKEEKVEEEDQLGSSEDDSKDELEDY